MIASLRRLFAIVTKELRQLGRDPLTLVMIIGIPTLQLVLFGYAINMDVRHLPAALLDQAQTHNSRELAAELAQAQVFEFRYQLRTAAELKDLLRAGDVSAALIIPADFEQRLATGDRPPVQLIVDGSDQVVQQSARQLAMAPVRQLLSKQTHSAVPPTQVEIVNFYNPERRAPMNTVPGLIGVILTMTMVMFTSMALVRERERGNLEFLITTPLSPFELTLGKVLPFVGIGLIQTSIILLLGIAIFGVPVRGSLTDLYLASLLYIIACLALGIFLSTMSQSQFQAMQVAFFTFLPQILMSGFMFPFDGMPKIAQWLAEVFPLTHFIRLVRGIVLRAADIGDMWVEMTALVAFTAGMLLIATLRFHKRLD